MKSLIFSISFGFIIHFSSLAQTHSRSIIIDQFGYLPDSKKIAVIKDPRIGFDSLESFVPGKSYSLVDAATGEKKYTSEIIVWRNGAIDKSSGDKVWHFDFSVIKEPGTYYILDEARWGIDHLLRLQQEDGSVLSIVGESHASPPSAAKGPSFYGPPNTSAALNTVAALAISSRVYRMIHMNEYADKLVNAALKSWEWAEANPNVLFNNYHRDYNSLGLGTGRMEVNDYSRLMIKLEAACFLFDVTGNPEFRDFFDATYMNAHLFTRNQSTPFETDDQEVLLYYTTLENGTRSIREQIKNTYRNTIVNGQDNMIAQENFTDPYFSYIRNYTWGSNSTKSAQGNLFYDVIYYGIDNALNQAARDAALTYIHYIHGVNPLNMVYLSNMYAYGGDHCANEFYHSWFSNGSEKWDRVGESVYGPAPGYLTGGANPRYNWDRCCPDNCNGEANNKMCLSESISPPRNQPDQKSYKDFNTSWPINSWEVTENSCSYQVNYIRLLSKFVASKNNSAEIPVK
jgi:hypothetical protein